MEHTKPSKLKTVIAETMIQRIARNIAWYALRIARPHFFKHKACLIDLVCLSDVHEAREWVRVMEEYDSNGKRPPVPLGHVIFRG